MHNLAIQLMIIGLAGFAAQWAAWRFHLPAIVFLLLTGFVFGPVLGILTPSDMFGDFMRPAVGVAVAIILFEASLNLDFREIRDVRRAVSHIVLIGAPLGWVLISWGAHYIGGMSWPTAVTFGGLLVVTGPTVIIPLLRTARLSHRVNSILKWEGIINDPIGVLFSVLALEYFVVSQNVDSVGAGFYLHFAVALAGVSVISFLLGIGINRLFQSGIIPEYLKSYFMLIVVISLFTISNMVIEELGLIAVTVLGVTLANIKVSSLDDIRRFKEVVTLLLVSGVFIVLTADLDPHVLLSIDLRGVAFIVFLLVLLRPIAVFVSSIGTTMTLKETLFISLIAPRGVVCAAVAAIMGPQLVDAGFADGEKLLPLAFAIVVITVLADSFCIERLAKYLSLSADKSNGLIIVGGSMWTTELGLLLKSKDIDVLIVDRSWNNLRDARQKGLATFYGEVLSEDAEYAIDFARYTNILAATEDPVYNALVCNAFVHELGRENVWQISESKDVNSKKVVATSLQGRPFVSEDVTAETIVGLIVAGARFKATRVGGELAGEDTLMSNPADIKIGVMQGGTLRFNSAKHNIAAKEGDVLIVLAQPQAAAATAATATPDEGKNAQS